MQIFREFFLIFSDFFFSSSPTHPLNVKKMLRIFENKITFVTKGSNGR